MAEQVLATQDVLEEAEKYFHGPAIAVQKRDNPSRQIEPIGGEGEKGSGVFEIDSYGVRV